jgi:membrane-associated phospholipid phosphatase
MIFWFRRFISFWVVLAIGLLALLIVLIMFDKAQGFLNIQVPHSQTVNFIFGMLTFPGDGLFALGVGLYLLLFNSYRNAITLISGYLVGSIIVQVCKNFIFSPTPRPVKWFELTNYPFVLPDGLNPHMWNSFPSGHSASAAALFFFIATLSNRSSIHLICGVMMMLVGYSRIYLYMHFPEDVFVGLIIGIFSMVLSKYFIDRWIEKKSPTWINNNLLKR